MFNFNKIKKFEIDPNDLIDEICFDPRISERYHELYKTTFQNIGYKGKIIKLRDKLLQKKINIKIVDNVWRITIN